MKMILAFLAYIGVPVVLGLLVLVVARCCGVPTRDALEVAIIIMFAGLFGTGMTAIGRDLR